MRADSKLMVLLSTLIDVPNVTIRSRIHGEIVSFAGPIAGVRFGQDTDPFVLVNLRDGSEFYVSLQGFEIRINGNGMNIDLSRSRGSLADQCLAIHDGQLCHNARGHESPHEWEVYALV